MSYKRYYRGKSRGNIPTHLIAIRNEGKVRDWVIRDDSSEFVINPTRSMAASSWVNVQIDLESVCVGDELWIALKEDILVGSTTKRLIAAYATKAVLSPEQCGMGDEDNVPHSTTICPTCIESWSWDYLVRKLPHDLHGGATAYLSYGCRCHPCAVYRMNQPDMEHASS